MKKINTIKNNYILYLTKNNVKKQLFSNTIYSCSFPNKLLIIKTAIF